MGFDVIAQNYQLESFDLDTNIKPTGIWLRGGFSAFVNRSPEFLFSFSQKLSSWADNGWGIVIPNNNLTKGHLRYKRLGDHTADDMIELQKIAMEENGWLSYKLHGQDKERYGMNKKPWSGSKYIFIKNL